ncbi:hypothetical protein BLA39750_00860 [Burkholderia lata]|uniref:GIY-YIG domain-containing protein n=2 Tax=Burkholderia lata (strain ATCC 17760 / DSM 23089 / LMG 22485 / NCIMB 9086 / R18194 / 383) TaxID=482957 RepID=A0A6P2UGF0_BURL3|nr:hypothetical protein BLA39750_00860 [Burkholderia lata]
MMYEINTLSKLEDEYRQAVKSHFADFFRNHDYEESHQKVVLYPVAKFEDAKTIYAGCGVYIILTDLDVGENPCRFARDGMRAVYRGHCTKVKSRIWSHLFNNRYRAGHKGGVYYDVCMKLWDENGINIDAEPYSNARWAVLVHKVAHSTEVMRIQAEKAFDEVFGRPVASREA